jgi:hypothetical protein
MAGSIRWVTSMRWAAYASRASCHSQSFALAISEPSASSRASESLLPSPWLRACCFRSLQPPPKPLASSREPSTASRASCRLQSFILAAPSLRPPPEPLTSSTTFDHLQSFLPPPELRAMLPPEPSTCSRPLTSSRPFDRLQSLLHLQSLLSLSMRPRLQTSLPPQPPDLRNLHTSEPPDLYGPPDLHNLQLSTRSHLDTFIHTRTDAPTHTYTPSSLDPSSTRANMATSLHISTPVYLHTTIPPSSVLCSSPRPTTAITSVITTHDPRPQPTTHNPQPTITQRVCEPYSASANHTTRLRTAQRVCELHNASANCTTHDPRPTPRCFDALMLTSCIQAYTTTCLHEFTS